MNLKSNASPGKVYDVLIVGAGLVGLATAISLRKRGVNNILVIDKTHEFRQVGQTLDLLPNGLKAIKSIESLAYQKIKEISLNLLNSSIEKNLDDQHSKTDQKKSSLKKRYWSQKNLDGEIIRSIPLDFKTWFDQYGEGRVSIPWYQLQTTLRSFLPPELIKINYRCVNLEKKPDYIKRNCVSNTVSENNPFAHWEMQRFSLKNEDKTEENKSNLLENKAFKAKLVVAADGINSAIRQVIYEDTNLSQWSKPQYSGWTAIACRSLDNVPESITEELNTKYFQGQSIITVTNDKIKKNSTLDESPRVILTSFKPHHLGYLIHSPFSLASLSQKSANDLIQLMLQVLEKSAFPSVIQQLVSLSNPDNLVKRPYYIHPANISNYNHSIWSQGKVVLVGDAAHGMPPFMAQGANQGLEDAAVIAPLITNIIQNNRLDDQEFISKQWAKYETIRRPFMEKIQEATMENHYWSQQQWDDYSEMVYSRNLEQLANSL